MFQYLEQQKQLHLLVLMKEKIDSLLNEVTQDKSLSKSEKDFIDGFCKPLSIKIQNTIDEKEPVKAENEINQCLEKMLRESNKIPRTSGFLGFINKIFEALGRKKPFNITNSEVISKVQGLKYELQHLKENSEIIPDKDNISSFK